jgi:hypothetical protein
MTGLLIKRSAVISDCGLYRMRLDRGLSMIGPRVAVLMVNPSDGDAERDDSTIAKLYGFAQRHRWGHLILGNKYAYRSKHVTDLQFVDDPVGPENDRYLEQIMREADLHVVAWGPLTKLPQRLRNRWKEVVAIANRVGVQLQCLGVAKDGHPRHPLMQAYDTPLTPWTPPKETAA